MNQSGIESNGPSEAARLTEDGRYVVFRSASANLVPGTPNFWWDIYRKDLQTGEVVRVSTTSAGGLSNQDSHSPVASANGRFVAFVSSANNLVGGDTNNQADVFVKDLDTGSIVRASIGASGEQGNSISFDPDISANGQFVSFTSGANNLVPGDGNFCVDIFRKDLATGALARATLSSTGLESNKDAGLSSISADGRYVSFATRATNLVAGDTLGFSDVFRKDFQTGTVIRISTSTSGAQANNMSEWQSMSADGSKIAFQSTASNLVPGDTNGQDDIFVKDLATGATVRASEGPAGLQGNGASMTPAISGNGTVVTFMTLANNFSPADSNSVTDVYRKDLATGDLRLLSQSDSGIVGNGWSQRADLDGDGSQAVFDSLADNLVAGDANQYIDVFLIRSALLSPPRVVSLLFRPQLQGKPKGLWVTAVLNAPPSERTAMSVDSPDAWLVPPGTVWLKGGSRLSPFFVRLTRGPVPGEKVSVRTTIGGVSFSASYKFPKR